MTFMMRIESELADTEWVVVRLLRRYAACRQLDEQPLPSLTRLGNELGIQPCAVVALASVFQLSEGCLGRSLIVECCFNRSLSADERAMLVLLTSGTNAGPIYTSRDIPHGLPGALVWAVACVRRLFDPAFPERAVSRFSINSAHSLNEGSYRIRRIPLPFYK